MARPCNWFPTRTSTRTRARLTVALFPSFPSLIDYPYSLSLPCFPPQIRTKLPSRYSNRIQLALTHPNGTQMASSTVLDHACTNTPPSALGGFNTGGLNFSERVVPDAPGVYVRILFFNLFLLAFSLAPPPIPPPLVVFPMMFVPVSSDHELTQSPYF